MESNIDRIKRHWASEFPEIDSADQPETLDYRLTTEALSLVLDRTNTLDATNFKILAFRINCLNRSLQTLDLLQTYKFWTRNPSLCIMCNTHQETENHIWSCPKVEAEFRNITLHAQKLIIKEVKSFCELKRLPHDDTTKDSVIEAIALFFHDFHDEDFLPSAEARGKITEPIKNNTENYTQP